MSDRNSEIQETESEVFPIRVVIVDDNAAACFILGRLLGKLGHDVFVAESANDAMKFIEKVRPEVVISDLDMPEVTGYDLARWIRGRFSSATPYLVALTGYCHASARTASFEAGFDEHLVKPIGLHALMELFKNVSSQTRRN